MGAGGVRNNFGIGVTCQVTLLRQVCMTIASLSALALGICPLMGYFFVSSVHLWAPRLPRLLLPFSM